jgi:Ca-activated chloride channel family protein
VNAWAGGAAALVALLVAAAGWRSRRDLARWLGADPWPARRWLRSAFLAGAALLAARAWTLAAATPPRLSGGGADVVVAFDVSRSMDAADSAPSRLRRALRVAEGLVREASAVRLGLVLFAGDAYVALPLTQDSDAFLAYLAALDTDLVSKAGSDVARGLDVAGRVFDPRSERARQVVLLSDGEHADGDLESALATLRSLGVRVVAVGFGTAEGSAVPGPGGDPLVDDEGRVVHSARADATLRRIAQATDGAYFRELEDAPAPARLLPAPQATVEPARDEATDPTAAALDALAALATALLALELALSLGSLSWRARRRALGAATALAALALAGVGPASWEEEGDAKLAAGDARGALSLYRRVERHGGETPSTQIRVGNALYRLGELDKAAAAYLAALRRLEPEQRSARFAAAFNLGATLLAREGFAEARDAFWSAMLEDPESVEAKFNYEWALARLEPEPDVPVPPSPTPSEAPEPSGSDAGEQRMQEPAPSEREAKNAQPLAQAEAERWLRSIDERVADPLRSQLAKRAETLGGASQGGQTW